VTFDQLNLDSRLLPAIADAGYHAPTPIQSATIPAVLAGDDVIGTAQTGTGRRPLRTADPEQTLARTAWSVRALIITPTRELAMQIDEVIRH